MLISDTHLGAGSTSLPSIAGSITQSAKCTSAIVARPSWDSRPDRLAFEPESCGSDWFEVAAVASTCRGHGLNISALIDVIRPRAR